MPRGDQTGPMGRGVACRRGPRYEGRGAMQGPGRGFGRRMSLGQGNRPDTKEFLETRKECLEERLQLINNQLEDQ